jgi:hypothetical protein
VKRCLWIYIGEALWLTKSYPAFLVNPVLAHKHLATTPALFLFFIMVQNDEESDTAALVVATNSSTTLLKKKLYNEDLFEHFGITFLPQAIEESSELTYILVSISLS